MMNAVHAAVYHASSPLFITPYSVFIPLSRVIFYAWLFGAALTLLSLARHRRLKPVDDERLKGRDAPLVSVLIPARNEEHRILSECVRTILAQDYGNFEVVAINDRSFDATGAILRALAATDARLRVIEGAQTRAGWLGKPYALQQALHAAQGSWILATDADMLFHPAALRTAIAHALEKHYDAVTFIPRFEAHSFWERIFTPTWSWSGLVFFQPELLNHPKSGMAIGVGGFFLMRRDALERVGGFEAVRAEVLDDLRMAEILKRAGTRIAVEYAPALVSTRMYSNFGELWESSTKNIFAILKFSVALTLAMLCWTFFMTLLPPLLVVLSASMIALGSTEEFWRQLLAPNLAVWLIFVSLHALVNRRFEVPARYALTAPLGWVLSCAVLLASAYGVLTGRGLTWKGRKFYERGGVRPPK
jgi:chlorobactene glucosyltransferase